MVFPPARPRRIKTPTPMGCPMPWRSPRVSGATAEAPSGWTFEASSVARREALARQTAAARAPNED